MCDVEIRRVMRVVLTAVDQVREAYREVEEAPSAAGGRQTKGGALRVELERAGKSLWEAQSLLVTDDVDRHGRQLKAHVAALREHAKVAGKAGQRDVAEALVDAADALEAVVEMMRLGVEAGLVG